MGRTPPAKSEDRPRARPGWPLIGVALAAALAYLLARRAIPSSLVDDGPAPGSRSLSASRPVSRPTTRWHRPRTAERQAERDRMVRHLVSAYRPKVSDPAVIKAMRAVPRHWFVPRSRQGSAYADSPLPIGYGQTISQPYMVAYMTQVLDLKPTDRVLEIGTGSGYQAAVLYEFTPNVYTIEIVKPLARAAKRRLADRGYQHIKVKHGDGYYGWNEHAPFDAIIVTCAAGHVPPPLLAQLKPGGRMCIPVKRGFGFGEDLRLITKRPDGRPVAKSLMGCAFVPMTGKVQER